MTGPWSEPVDLGITGAIDPGHAVGENGRRYLFLNGVRRVRLTDDGLATDGPVEHVYDGWRYPDDWVTEAYALEGPKLFRRGEWFYLVSAVGGTAGPSTSHMVTVARSRSVHGPWENDPANPVVRTRDAAEAWWSRGHATAVEGPAGDWWLVYHGYERGFRTLGRQVLLEPIEWTDDGWFRALGGDLSGAIRRPADLPGLPGSRPGMTLSDRLGSSVSPISALASRSSLIVLCPADLRQSPTPRGTLGPLGGRISCQPHRGQATEEIAMPSVRTVLVVGGGAAGCAAAILFARDGAAVDLIEVKPDVSALGSGITVQSNALRVLRQLGVWDEVSAAGYAFTTLGLRAPDGTLLMEMDDVRTGGPDLPATVGMYRPTLAGILTEAAAAAGVVEKINVPFLIAHGASDRQIPLEYAHRSYEQAVGSPKRELRVFTAEEGATEHSGLDHLPHVSTFIADWVADTFAELRASRRP